MDKQKLTIKELKASLKRIKTYYSDRVDNFKPMNVSEKAIETFSQSEKSEYFDRAGLMSLLAISEANKCYIPNVNAPNVLDEHNKITEELIIAHGEEHGISVPEAKESIVALGMGYEQILEIASGILTDTIQTDEDLEKSINSDIVDALKKSGDAESDEPELLKNKQDEDGQGALDEANSLNSDALIDALSEKFNDPIDFDASTTDVFPTEEKGTTYKVKVAGIVAGIQLEDGDTIAYTETGNEPIVIQKNVTSDVKKEPILGDSPEVGKEYKELAEGKTEPIEEVFEKGDTPESEESLDSLVQEASDDAEKIADEVSESQKEDEKEIPEVEVKLEETTVEGGMVVDFASAQFVKGGKAKLVAVLKEKGLDAEIEQVNEKLSVSFTHEVYEEIKSFIK